jgi:hypothetical protein
VIVVVEASVVVVPFARIEGAKRTTSVAMAVVKRILTGCAAGNRKY